MSFRIYEGMEFFYYLFSIEFKGGNFGDTVMIGMESCGFKVKDNEVGHKGLVYGLKDSRRLWF
jgi:hypothetical protein